MTASAAVLDAPNRLAAASCRNTLIENHKPLVDSIVGCLLGRRRIPGFDRDDLIQEGRIGLIQAADSFNPHRGTTFITHASNCIRNSICSALRSSGVQIRNDELATDLTFDDERFAVSDETASVESRLAAAHLLSHLPEQTRNVVKMRYLLELTQVEIAQQLGISERHVRRLLESGMATLRQAANSND